MPLMWSLASDDRSLPRAIAGEWFYLTGVARRSDGLLAKQRAKLMRDFAHVRSSFPNLSFQSYRYHWLLVNTRSFYYDLLPGEKPASQNDCMVLCPFADYFNHADHGVCSIRVDIKTTLLIFQCNVTFNENGFSIMADREYGIDLSCLRVITGSF